MSRTLPFQVILKPLVMHPDERGSVTEIYRDEWFSRDELPCKPVQWNAVHSRARAGRGFHVHFRHWDTLVLLAGQAAFGLRDLRKDSPTYGQSALVESTGEKLQALIIPPGVGHGFCFMAESMLVYSVSHYWDRADELGCHFYDPALQIDWPVKDAILSPHDQKAGSLLELEREFSARSKS